MPRGVITVSTLALAIAAPAVHAQMHSSVHVVTTARGTFLVPGKPGDVQDSSGATSRDIAWTFFDAASIPESLALAPDTNSAWVAQDLNFPRIQRFELSGSGTPAAEFPLSTTNAVGIAAAQGADRSASLTFEGGRFIVRTFTSAGPSWTRTFGPNFDQGNLYYNVDVSNDGSTVAVVLNDSTAYTTTLWVLNGTDGSIRQTWSDTGTSNAVDLTDDGSLALVTYDFFQNPIQRDSGRVINTTTGAMIFEGLANASGGRFPISGDGSTFATGAFNMRIFHRTGGTYVQTRVFSAANSWFGWGLAVSRDGSTVGVRSHDYASGYLNTTTRVFDATSGTLLGSYDTFGSGSLQGAVSGAAMNDDGTLLAVSSWGTADDETAEVLILDRTANLVGSLNTNGSVFSLDMSNDGHYVLVGNKNAHANTFGSGGTVTLLSLGADCPADFDGDGFVTGVDFDLFVAAFEAGDMAADFDGDGFITGVDFDLYVGAFEAGC